MALHPVDLQGIYAQMDNVAKFGASENSYIQASNQASLEKSAKLASQKSKTVNKSAENESMATTVKNNRNGGSGDQGQELDAKKKDGSGSPDEDSGNLDDLNNLDNLEWKDPLLGNHIDVVG